MSIRVLRLVGFLATGSALALAVLHLLSLKGKAPLERDEIVAAAFPIMLLVGLTYIAATHRKDAVLARPPLWMLALWGASVIYAIAVERLQDRIMEGGILWHGDGQVSLRDHGRLIRVLAPGEVRELEVWQVRAWSAGLLPFLLLPGLALFAVTRRRPGETGEAAA